MAAMQEVFIILKIVPIIIQLLALLVLDLIKTNQQFAMVNLVIWKMRLKLTTTPQEFLVGNWVPPSPLILAIMALLPQSLAIIVEISSKQLVMA